MIIEDKKFTRGHAMAGALALTLLATAGTLAEIHAQTDAAPPALGASEFNPRQVSISDLKPRSAWKNAGTATPEACFETSCWAQAAGDVDAMMATILLDDTARATAQNAFDLLPADQQKKIGNADRLIATRMAARPPFAATKVLEVAQTASGADEVRLHTLWQYGDGRIRENTATVLRHTADGWRQVFPMKLIAAVLQTKPAGSGRTSGPARGLSPESKAGKPAAIAGNTLAAGLVPVDKLQNRGAATPVAGFETLYWAVDHLDLPRLQSQIVSGAISTESAKAKFASLPADIRSKYPKATTPEQWRVLAWATDNRKTGIQVDTATTIDADRCYLSGRWQDETGAGNFDIVMRRTKDGWKWFMDETPNEAISAAPRSASK